MRKFINFNNQKMFINLSSTHFQVTFPSFSIPLILLAAGSVNDFACLLLSVISPYPFWRSKPAKRAEAAQRRRCRGGGQIWRILVKYRSSPIMNHQQPPPPPALPLKDMVHTIFSPGTIPIENIRFRWARIANGR